MEQTWIVWQLTAQRDGKVEGRDMGLMSCCVGCGTLEALDKWWPVSVCHFDMHNLHTSGAPPWIPPDTSTSSPASSVLLWAI